MKSLVRSLALLIASLFFSFGAVSLMNSCESMKDLCEGSESDLCDSINNYESKSEREAEKENCRRTNLLFVLYYYNMDCEVYTGTEKDECEREKKHNIQYWGALYFYCPNTMM